MRSANSSAYSTWCRLHSTAIEFVRGATQVVEHHRAVFGSRLATGSSARITAAAAPAPGQCPRAAAVRRRAGRRGPERGRRERRAAAHRARCHVFAGKQLQRGPPRRACAPAARSARSSAPTGAAPDCDPGRSCRCGERTSRSPARSRGTRLARHAHLARSRLDQAVETAQQSGLARPRRAQHDAHLARRRPRRSDTAQRREPRRSAWSARGPRSFHLLQVEVEQPWRCRARRRRRRHWWVPSA